MPVLPDCRPVCGEPVRSGAGKGCYGKCIITFEVLGLDLSFSRYTNSTLIVPKNAALKKNLPFAQSKATMIVIVVEKSPF